MYFSIITILSFVTKISLFEIGSFENRKSLPSKWRGLKDKELQDATGVKTARFCHNAGFICSADSKEGALELAAMANS